MTKGRARGAKIVVDYARSRRDFVLVTFPEEPEEDGLPLAPPTAAAPDPKALDMLVASEVPFFAPLERSP